MYRPRKGLKIPVLLIGMEKKDNFSLGITSMFPTQTFLMRVTTLFKVEKINFFFELSLLLLLIWSYAI